MLAIIIGHEARKPGAMGTAPLSKSEYEWNTAVAAELYRLAREEGLDCKVFTRDGRTIDNVAQNVNGWAWDDTKPACCVELHFNASAFEKTVLDGAGEPKVVVVKGAARGTEVLYDADPASGKELAEDVYDEVCRLFARTGKQKRGVKLLDDAQDRGYASLKAVKIPAVIVEPAFGDNKEDALLLAGAEKKYAQALCNAVQKFLRR